MQSNREASGVRYADTFFIRQQKEYKLNKKKKKRQPKLPLFLQKEWFRPIL